MPCTNCRCIAKKTTRVGKVASMAASMITPKSGK